MHAVNTAHKISDYAKSTTTGVICNHLFKKHKADWFEACKKFNLQVSGIQYKSAFAEYFSLPQTASTDDTSQPKFSPETFVDTLVEFVVRDDLVCYSILLF